MRFEKRNGKAYLYFMDTDYFEPRLITSYWEIDIDPSILPDNPQIYKLMNTWIAKTDYKEISLRISEYPTFTEFSPIKPPKKTGYKWEHGEWVKNRD